MEYEDQVTISTPEGVDLRLTLAGVGSRFASALVDLAIQTALLLALLVVFAIGGFGGVAGVAVYTLLGFLIFAGYDILFEVYSAGRTPGKRWNGLRVVQTDGRPVGFATSSVRNVLRLIDFQPFAYLVGIVAVLVTRRNQRLGDLAAGTLVVRERRAIAPRLTPPREPLAAEAAAWDVSAVTREEVAAIRLFLQRRDDLDAGVRADRARELAAAIRPKVVGVPDHLGSEAFLTLLVAAKQRRSE